MPQQQGAQHHDAAFAIGHLVAGLKAGPLERVGQEHLFHVDAGERDRTTILRDHFVTCRAEHELGVSIGVGKEVNLLSILSGSVNRRRNLFNL
jgi:hypothetical protein